MLSMSLGAFQRAFAVKHLGSALSLTSRYDGLPDHKDAEPVPAPVAAKPGHSLRNCWRPYCRSSLPAFFSTASGSEVPGSSGEKVSEAAQKLADAAAQSATHPEDLVRHLALHASSALPCELPGTAQPIFTQFFPQLPSLLSGHGPWPATGGGVWRVGICGQPRVRTRREDGAGCDERLTAWPPSAPVGQLGQ